MKCNRKKFTSKPSRSPQSRVVEFRSVMMRNTCRVFIIYFAQNPDETNGGTQEVKF